MGRTVTGMLVLLLAGAACGGSAEQLAVPLPEPTTEPRSEELPDYRVRVWPNSARVEEDVPYRIDVYTHCGLDHLLDFDGSFWEVTQGPEAPELGDPEDEGVITLESEDRAVYRSSTGATFELRRLEGPREIYLCE